MCFRPLELSCSVSLSPYLFLIYFWNFNASFGSQWRLFPPCYTSECFFFNADYRSIIILADLVSFIPLVKFCRLCHGYVKRYPFYLLPLSVLKFVAAAATLYAAVDANYASSFRVLITISASAAEWHFRTIFLANNNPNFPLINVLSQLRQLRLRDCLFWFPQLNGC